MAEDCPRCGVTDTEVVATSPVEDVWTLYRCDRCEFVWRDTEDREELTPHFDASDEELANADAVPPVEYPED
ncbi:hypothetical protein MBEHAL_1906 [Halarchaeum acidiphilum MH1-52-1]|uniref:Hydroxyaromatic non-oxidative decarboxylase protein D n=1 Tax=Halarchaeum acidiphilum MH1-52-1 TaxID=1261545 RepID=U2YG21_9EURY|nr:non-oxidative hydroxyarylic acid decarboxylases subunit D [Halarchaeum acidiphilum]GAD53146.1 hypothetical protein MBEHAL_1906 [Halarchaeum acidiphilum MH1-52-1]